VKTPQLTTSKPGIDHPSTELLPSGVIKESRNDSLEFFSLTSTSLSSILPTSSRLRLPILDPKLNASSRWAQTYEYGEHGSDRPSRKVGYEPKRLGSSQNHPRRNDRNCREQVQQLIDTTNSSTICRITLPVPRLWVLDSWGLPANLTSTLGAAPSWLRLVHLASSTSSAP